MSSATSSTVGIGPARHARRWWASAWRWCRSCLISFLQVLQRPGQRDILTSFVTQSTSGLCSLSQVYPRIASCFPRPVTANWTRSEWSNESEEHTSELQSHLKLVCRLLL